jgi:hypothetical protein
VKFLVKLKISGEHEMIVDAFDEDDAKLVAEGEWEDKAELLGIHASGSAYEVECLEWPDPSYGGTDTVAEKRLEY